MPDRGTLRSQVRAEIVEPTAGFWSDAEINTWLGEADEELVRLADIEVEGAEITTSAGTASYTLATDFRRMRQVRYSEDGGVTYSYLYPDTVECWTNTSGTPTHYFILAGKLYLSPVPNVAGKLQYIYLKKATAMTADTGVGSTPTIPSEYHSLLVRYAVGQCKRKADDPAYVTYMRDYEAGKWAMVAELSAKGVSERRPVIRDDWTEY